MTKSYRVQLRELEATQRRERRRELLDQAEYRNLKSRLTRAKNSGDGHKVLAEVELAVERFNATTWPDDWNRWSIALVDAEQQARLQGNGGLSEELYAAGVILFSSF